MTKIEIQKVSASHGWLWIKNGYKLITRSPLQAVSLAMTFALGVVVAMMIPFVGILLAILIMPVLMAGYMRVCRALEYSEKVEPRFIIAGFENRTTQLVSLGGILFLGIMVISILTIKMGGNALSVILQNFQTQQDTTALIEALMSPESGIGLAILLGFSMFLVLMLTLQFAPMLVFFNQMSPRKAMLTSLQASIRNFLPFLIYSVIIQLIAFVASVIPYELGLFILLPLGLTSMYVAYRDIFSEVKEAELVAE